MKAFARLDVAIQVILIIIGISIGLAVASNSIQSDYMFVPYFLVGGWQIFSVIVHLVGEGFRFGTMRKIYLVTLLLVLVILIISVPTEAIIYSLMGLLFFSPLMAIFYLATCYKELQQYKLTAPDQTNNQPTAGNNDLISQES
ncbi:hypothetical protein [Pseudobacter ginsenosidimutans]|uniref:Uncharacterized protein n=1 Tax=Pseudobacter ginsenosidimutans TaxID=661488 RepID=A0A4Q7MR98_9BACT|nr:hypothetical protein [Pseudobacter ginsenosidimutans]QEC42219.1 hypothetical protein FSB84_11145 [Pseudobacter ginsenosidimutans]RZS70938.1 hypothetical protein EV199_2837 [Pseudobacter ginsenosidimutans]